MENRRLEDAYIKAQWFLDVKSSVVWGLGVERETHGKVNVWQGNSVMAKDIKE